MKRIARIMIEVTKLGDSGYVATAENLMDNDQDGYSVNVESIEDLNPGIKECLDKLLNPVP